MKVLVTLDVSHVINKKPVLTPGSSHTFPAMMPEGSRWRVVGINKHNGDPICQSAVCENDTCELNWSDVSLEGTVILIDASQKEEDFNLPQ